MKSLSVQKELGSNGAVSASLAIEGEDLVLEVAAKYKKPISEVVEPVLKVADSFVDKLEAFIPGDQKAMAEAAKADLKAAIVKAITEAGKIQE